MSPEVMQRFINFQYELSLTTINFPNRLLTLFTKYFGEQYLLFCPYPDSRLNKDGNPYAGIIGKNFDSKNLRELLQALQTDDIFSASHLPASFKNKTVLTIHDLTSTNPDGCVHYQQYLQRAGLTDQACIYLTSHGIKISSLSVFRTTSEKPFSTEDQELFELIGKHVSRTYNAIRNPLDQYVKYFHSFFDGLDIGAALLDNHLLLIDANEEFRKYAKLIVTEGHLDQTIVTINNTHTTDENKYSQQLIDHLGINLVQKAERIRIECFQYHFQVYSKPIYLSAMLGQVETMYLIEFVKRTKIRSYETMNAFKELTSREKDILNLILKGIENEEIADTLSISFHTLKTHLQNIYRKFNVVSKTELLVKLLNERHRF